MFVYYQSYNHIPPAYALDAEVKHQNTSEATVYPANYSLKLRIWLLAVNNRLSKSSVDILKLGLLGDQNAVPYEVLDRAKHPSDIFNALEDHLQSKEAAVKRFIYALKRLGKARYGSVCAREYQERVGKRPPPKFETRNESETFGFCQCLVDICVKIKEEVSEAIIQYCGHYLLDMNRDKFRSLAHMFTVMCHKKFIEPKNPEKLAIVLTICEANECVKYIQNYLSKYNFSKMVIHPDKVKQLEGKHGYKNMCLHVNVVFD